MSWSEREEDLVQEAVDLIWREHGRVNGTPCYEAALRMLQCSRAAEERGRRRGVEELDAIVKRWEALHDGHSIDCEEAAHRRECICRAALAPRDSAPWRKCEFCGCETNANLRACCDKGRAADSGICRCTVMTGGHVVHVLPCVRAPRDSGKETK